MFFCFWPDYVWRRRLCQRSDDWDSPPSEFFFLPMFWRPAWITMSQPFSTTQAANRKYFAENIYLNRGENIWDIPSDRYECWYHAVETQNCHNQQQFQSAVIAHDGVFAHFVNHSVLNISVHLVLSSCLGRFPLCSLFHDIYNWRLE